MVCACDRGQDLLYSPSTCLHTTTFILFSVFSPAEQISLKIWERPLPIPVSVPVSKTLFDKALYCKNYLAPAKLVILTVEADEKFNIFLALMW